MKKKVSKAKPSKRSAKVEEPALPSLVEAMMKIAERLESLEKKMDVVLSQRQQQHLSQSHQQQPRPQFQPPQNYGNTRPQQQHTPSHNQNFQQHNRDNRGNHGNQGFQPPQHNQQNPGRQLFRAVCADCHKSCEVPFKPTGERPTYCKECFAKRKSGSHSGNSGPKNFQKSAPQIPASLEKRLVKVTPNGVGKVTISEMVPARGKSSKKKPAKKR